MTHEIIPFTLKMLFLKKWFNVTLLLLLELRVCSLQNVAIQQLNLKFDRLKRITNGLQRDVDDIWTALSNIATANSSKVNQGLTNETEKGYSTTENVLKRVNEAISDVEDLKKEVEELMVYTQNGLKNEKAFSHQAIQKIQNRQSAFETNVSNNIEEMKNWQLKSEQMQKQTLEVMFEDFRAKSAEDNRILLEKLKNLTNSYERQLVENKLDVKACHEKIETIGQNLTSIENHITDVAAQVKGEIYEKLQQALTCEDSWISFGTNCYYLSSEKMSWDDAWEFCKTNYSHIVELKEKTEINFLVVTFKSLYTVWVGGHDRETEGTFVWQTSKKSIASDYFFPGEPSNSWGGEHCAELYCSSSRVGKLNDANCGGKKNFVCEKSKFTFP